MRFLTARLDADTRQATIATVFSRGNACVVVTKQLEPPDGLIEAADTAQVPLLRTTLSTPVAFAKLGALLDDLLAPRTSRHGVLVDVLGLGVLMVGESGIGKSECALELIRLRPPPRRGRRRRRPPARRRHRHRHLSAADAPPHGAARHRPDQRPGSLRRHRDADLEARRARRQAGTLGPDAANTSGSASTRRSSDILGVPIASVCMPVAPGRNLAILVEVAVRNHLLRARGEHAARRLAARLDHALALDPASGEDPEEAA